MNGFCVVYFSFHRRRQNKRTLQLQELRKQKNGASYKLVRNVGHFLPLVASARYCFLIDC